MTTSPSSGPESESHANAFNLAASGPFELAASIRFLEGFAPAAGQAEQQADRLTLAFAVERSWKPVAVQVEHRKGRVLGRFTGNADGAAVQRQVRRILSLDVDGTDFPAVGERDPVAGRLQRRYPGLRPVGFWSPYEAAAWTILSQRIRIVQAARLKQQITDVYGDPMIIDGRTLRAFPAPERLLRLKQIPGVPEVKLGRLHAVARAAIDGVLDGERLRARTAESAIEQLQEIAGIGPFSAELILIRGAGAPDVFANQERRLHDSMRAAYGQPSADVEKLRQIAERWRPYRSWVGLLFRTAREDDTHEIAGVARPLTGRQ
jgi:3-methyladenine DNA glycosylase/8-oxoguanine DNA glycosylase